MTRSQLTYALLDGVSYKALEAGLRVGQAYGRDARVDLNAGLFLGLIARVRLWLQLFWYRSKVEVQTASITSDTPRNRHYARKRARKLPTARRADTLVLHILSRKGWTKARQWLYDRTLAGGRVRWCITQWKWPWASRPSLAVCEGESQLGLSCEAPLRPD